MGNQHLIRSSKVLGMALAVRRLVRPNSCLSMSGWYESFRKKMPCDRLGNALPWYTYAAISFIEPRIFNGMNVFEYGSGNSTIWWANRVGHIVSCEHDEQWHEVMRKDMPECVDYRLRPLSEGPNRYQDEIGKFSAEFDIIIVDGRERVSCAKNSLVALKRDGVVLWDNSDRSRYEEGFSFLHENGFKRLDFSGMGPINAYGWCTSIFYRPDNCLGV